MIEIVDLYKKYDNKPVLNGINLTINKGETLTIIGRSGEGKSVLLKHIIGLLKPDSGQIIIDGDDITQMPHKEILHLRQRFGMLFQSSALFDSMTVEENVGLGLREFAKYPDAQIEQIVKEKLAIVGLEGIESRKPAELSGGMKKRVGLARAIAMNPEFILYDEPTTGLDPIMADTINELIVKMKNSLKITSIAVTHDMASAFKISDTIAMLHGGKIIFCGSPEEFRSLPDPIVRQFINGRADNGNITNNS